MLPSSAGTDEKFAKFKIPETLVGQRDSPGTSCLSKTLQRTLLRNPGFPAVHDLKSRRQLK